MNKKHMWGLVGFLLGAFLGSRIFGAVRGVLKV